MVQELPTCCLHVKEVLRQECDQKDTLSCLLLAEVTQS